MLLCVFCFKERKAYERLRGLVRWEMWRRDRCVCECVSVCVCVRKCTCLRTAIGSGKFNEVEFGGCDRLAVNLCVWGWVCVCVSVSEFVCACCRLYTSYAADE